MNNHRDQVIDLFKGFTILWVIHIHTVFWSGYLYLPNYLRELSLFIDVPIFFFLSGYLIFTGSLKDIFKKSVRQFKRLYLTYLFISLVVYFFIVFIKFLSGYSSPDILQNLFALIHLYANFPELRGLGKNLWFLRTYLFLIIILPVFAIGHVSLSRSVLLSALFFSLFLFGRKYGYKGFFGFNIIQVFFYATYFFLGSTFRIIEKKITLKQFTILFSIILLFIGIAIHNDEYTIILQGHKFPPSIPYFLYSLPYIFIFIFFKLFYPNQLSNIPSTIKKTLIWSSNEVFNIYILHSFICYLPYFIIPNFVGEISPFILYFITLLFNLISTISVVWIYKRIVFQFCINNGNLITTKINSCAFYLLRRFRLIQ